MKAIPTTYAGVEFRSRLEARWAVFFDALGVNWTYEREGYELPSGNYLPDFWLPGIRGGSWFEVKGADPTRQEQVSCSDLAQATGSDVMLVSGDMPRRHEITPFGTSCDRDRLGTLELVYFNPEGADVWYSWCVCRCGKVGIEFEARSDRVCSDHTKYHDTPEWALGDGLYRGMTHGDRAHTGDHPNIVNAYEAARAYQFWKPGAK